jgi:hypothetical protein
MECRSCPLSLRCLAGKLGDITFCPWCGYTTVSEAGVGEINDPDDKQIRLRCEQRQPSTLDYPKDLVEGQGSIAADPTGRNVAVAMCSKCYAERRRYLGWATRDPSFYTKFELD